MKKLMLGLMMAFAVTAARAEAWNKAIIDGVQYEIWGTQDGAPYIVITGYDSDNPPTKVDVSEVEWNGTKQPIADVVRNAFSSCGSLESVVLPSVGDCWEYAFSGCQNLKEISLPNATEIHDSSFAGCSSLTSVFLPNATEIFGFVFSDCEKLTSLSLPNATRIRLSAFSGCQNLKEVSLPNATTIEGSVFENCSALETVTVKNAEMKAELENNRSKYGLGDGVKIIDGSHTIYTYTLTDTLTAELDDQGVLTIIGSGAMPDWASADGQPWKNERSRIKSVVAEGVTSVGNYAFAGCSSLTSVSLPFVVVTSWTGVFTGCENLKKIVVNSTAKAALEKSRDVSGLVDSCEIDVADVVTIVASPEQHSTAKIYVDGVEKMGSTIVVLPNTKVTVVFTAEEGFCFAGDHSTIRTNTVEATNDPTTVVGPAVVKESSMSEEVARQAEWKAETTVTVSAALKSGEVTLDKAEYKYACEFYGVEAKAEPTAEDFKVVSKGAEIVPEGHIAVSKESIAAPSAGTVKVEDNKVQLGVTVLKTSDLTAEKKEWGEVTLTADDVKVVDGKIVISVPVDSASGFMVIQTKDAAK